MAGHFNPSQWVLALSLNFSSRLFLQLVQVVSFHELML
jgi:hypothetical protein